ncbi:MAG: glycosyltransferase family 4 protein [Ferruginibacter sp.]
MHSGVLFLTLKVFSSTGGIEKVCRIAGKAMYENCTRFNKRLQIFSMHDNRESAADNLYFPMEIFTAFDAHKINFMRDALKQGRKSQVIILSHINLLLAAWLIKKVHPSVKVILFAHGIEVWQPLNNFKRKMLDCCDEIVSVSEYTRDKMIEVHKVDPSKCSVMNNCLDPFLPLSKNVKVSLELKEKYGFRSTDRILFTLTRLSAKERYKGYDKVMEAMVQIGDKDVRYLIAGSYDAAEKEYIDAVIARLKLEGRVALAGFIPDEEVATHFAMSDCYVMPSIKEGFGIVFIEAMYYGLPVIAGNADGSVDALRKGKLGLLVDPNNVTEIKSAILEVLNNKERYLPDEKLLLENFSYDSYKEKMNALFNKIEGWELEGSGLKVITNRGAQMRAPEKV